ncbi:MAG: sigma-70 family RNA polymerase sigma factor [Oscillospiraceae bacterium]
MRNTENYNLFVIFIKENQEKFYRLAYSYVRNRETALDLVQDAIISALTNLNKLKNPEYIKTWFYRILVNTCLMYLRKNKSTPDLKILSDDIPVSYDFRKGIENECVLMAINKLSPDLKTVVFLRFYEDMKFDEISEVTKINVNTVKSRIYKALDLLKSELGDNFYNENEA